MLYETQRIIDKQKKYIKSRAYTTLSQIKNKGLTDSQGVDHINMLLSKNPSEFEAEILRYAKQILLSKGEDKNENNFN